MRNDLWKGVIFNTQPRGYCWVYVTQMLLKKDKHIFTFTHINWSKKPPTTAIIPARCHCKNWENVGVTKIPLEYKHTDLCRKLF